MNIYILMAASRRCAIIWRTCPEGNYHEVRQTCHYWMTTASWCRIQRIAAQGHLVRVYQDEQTYLLQGGAQ